LDVDEGTIRRAPTLTPVNTPRSAPVSAPRSRDRSSSCSRFAAQRGQNALEGVLLPLQLMSQLGIFRSGHLAAKVREIEPEALTKDSEVI